MFNPDDYELISKDEDKDTGTIRMNLRMKPDRIPKGARVIDTSKWDRSIILDEGFDEYKIIKIAKELGCEYEVTRRDGKIKSVRYIDIPLKVTLKPTLIETYKKAAYYL